MNTYGDATSLNWA